MEVRCLPYASNFRLLMERISAMQNDLNTLAYFYLPLLYLRWMTEWKLGRRAKDFWILEIGATWR